MNYTEIYPFIFFTKLSLYKFCDVFLCQFYSVDYMEWMDNDPSFGISFECMF